MAETVVVSVARTPFVTFGGALKEIPATDLGAVAIRGALDRAGVDGAAIDYVFMGQVVQAGAGQIPSRQATMKAGMPETVPSDTINKVCASSLRAVNLADLAIRAGDITSAVAGGMESMSQAPYLLRGAREGFRLDHAQAYDGAIYDGLTNPFSGKRMIEEAGAVGAELDIPRTELDRWATRSQTRAAQATSEGRLAEEIVPVSVASGKSDVVLDADEGLRGDTSIERLAKLKPADSGAGTHTAGNSPGINDGAAALVVASRGYAEAHGHEPLAQILAYGMVADDFAYLARTPAAAARRALAAIGKTPKDVDLWEINEAFASVALNSIRSLEIDEERVNVNGGAIAIGHPLGASGGRIIGALVQELLRRGGGLGCAAICSGGGQGDAIVVAV